MQNEFWCHDIIVSIYKQYTDQPEETAPTSSATDGASCGGLDFSLKSFLDGISKLYQ